MFCLKGRQITAMGKPWHPECFTCTICVKPLTPESYKEHAGKPYCEDDYHKLFSPKCGGCALPITDVSITSSGQSVTLYWIRRQIYSSKLPKLKFKFLFSI